jgi:hypothetical protein
MAIVPSVVDTDLRFFLHFSQIALQATAAETFNSGKTYTMNLRSTSREVNWNLIL